MAHRLDSELYGVIGGANACRALAEDFYARVERDPVLRPLFPGKSMRCAIEEFSAFLVQFLGGPSEHSQKRWWLSLRESHQRFQIGAAERTAWMNNMAETLREAPMDEPARAQLLEFFAQASAYVVNTTELRTPESGLNAELSRRWDTQQHLDQAVAAIRTGNAPLAIALTNALREHAAPSVHAGVLALMIRSGQDALLDYLRTALTADPAWIHERYAGRTLLHDAAAAGSLAMVKLLLDLGLNPDIRDGGAHTPLYALANECAQAGTAAVVHALINAGADVNASNGAKRCTPLHMAARRGHVETASALLDCGANIEARDNVGDTPLRRAVNCNKLQLAALLVSRGADQKSIGSKGATPSTAARSAAMKGLLQERMLR